ncbi:AraC family transcriptional regulator [Shimia haliotis]|uniref:AraC-type DNA-binding protein n=1 Tax=Shimia haliotis TaxID=1280847 RepID=A0A1I4GR09_9RHOB|nr:AraC family transcriptional regulator [Shimia haliotis]SFL32522.1 AraC-type DNA-binding protein [Shimia haliotis]
MDVIDSVKTTYGFGSGAGFVETFNPAVRFFWSTQPVARAPLIYKAGLVIILQGSKVGYLEDRVFHYDRDQYLALSVPIPFDCATTASEADPLLGLFIDLDLTEVNDLARVLPLETAPTKSFTQIGVEPAPVGTEMHQSIARLLQTLTSRPASLAIGKGLVREITFHALQGPHGLALRSMTQTDSHHDKISRSIARIRENYTEDLTVEDLARDAAMSTSVFHRAFKDITGSSPHQYLKTTRLHRAKGLIVSHGFPVGEAARRVGYDNPAHFSREFKKLFNVSPKAAQMAGYQEIDI